MKTPARYFRAGVGAVIRNGTGHVLALERAEIPGAWQFPQGGWEADESAEEAVYREVQEETGLGGEQLQLMRKLPEPLVYELPAECQSTKTGLGQALYWYLFQLRAAEDELILPVGGEFRAWSWLPMSRVVESTAPFRRAVYQRLAEAFGLDEEERR